MPSEISTKPGRGGRPVKVEELMATIQPKNNCKHCHGTGRIGFIDGDENKPLPCRCVIKIYQKKKEDEVAQKKLEAKKAVMKDVEKEIKESEKSEAKAEDVKD